MEGAAWGVRKVVTPDSISKKNIRIGKYLIHNPVVIIYK